jgi:putative hydrolase of the HAD superfamily
MVIGSWVDEILQHRAEMQPLNTTVDPKLERLSGIKAVVFDIYGTLVISGCGDVGSADAVGRGSFVRQTLEEIGLLGKLASVPDAESLQRNIQQLNQDRVNPRCPKPEVDIVEVWRQVLAEVGWVGCPEEIELVVRLATRYEALVNPTWPMPGASELLQQLKKSGCSMGIVSNAQIFTPCLINNLLGDRGLEEGGFSLDLCVFSNRYRQAKPGPRLFEVILRGLLNRGILPNEALYVGNDMLNDIWAASAAGLRTAWFAGDQRSCRPRLEDSRCQSLSPDVVLTNLMQLPECLMIS